MTCLLYSLFLTVVLYGSTGQAFNLERHPWHEMTTYPNQRSSRPVMLFPTEERGAWSLASGGSSRQPRHHTTVPMQDLVKRGAGQFYSGIHILSFEKQPVHFPEKNIMITDYCVLWCVPSLLAASCQSSFCSFGDTSFYGSSPLLMW